jgi:hypothetical protein
MRKVLLNGLLLLIGLYSCQKEIEYDGPGREARLVVNAVVTLDSTFVVRLERTAFFLSEETPQDRYITSGASIMVTNLTTGEVFYESSPVVENRYEFPFIVTPNTSYRIDVSHPDYPQVSSQITTVPHVILQSVDTIPAIQDNQMVMEGNFKWQDPPGKQYYMIKIIQDYQDINGQYVNNVPLISTDAAIDNTNNQNILGNIDYSSYLLFTDETFDSQNKELKVRFYYSFYPDPSTTIDYYCHLITLSEEAYYYYRSLNASLNAGFLSEPVKVFSNIANGYGVFGSKNHSVVPL